MPFQPGQSGNPGGRPKAVQAVQAAAREHTALAIETLARIAGDEKQPAAARVSAADVLLDRGWGRAPQTVRLDGPEAMTDDQLNRAIDDRLAALLASGGSRAEDAGAGGASPGDPERSDGVVH